MYAFAKKCGHRRARLWPSVLRELRVAIALVPLVRSDLSRPVADVLIQTDASGNGSGVVYTREVPHDDLRRECTRPRTEPRNPDDQWEVQRAWGADFEAPQDPSAWRVAVRRRLRGPARLAHIRFYGRGGRSSEGAFLKAAAAAALPTPGGSHFGRTVNS